MPGENEPDTDPDIQPLFLTDDQISDLVAFLKSLTDERVKCEEAPFDHPQAFVPDGHPVDETMATDSNNDGQADDDLLKVPAVGAGGRLAKGLACLKPFLE